MIKQLNYSNPMLPIFFLSRGISAAVTYILLITWNSCYSSDSFYRDFRLQSLREVFFVSVIVFFYENVLLIIKLDWKGSSNTHCNATFIFLLIRFFGFWFLLQKFRIAIWEKIACLHPTSFCFQKLFSVTAHTIFPLTWVRTCSNTGNTVWLIQ